MFFEQELKRLFGKSSLIRDAEYCGKTMIGRIDDELRVKLEFVTTGHADRYTALRLKIINRTEGEVDKETFRFRDILADMSAEKTFGRNNDVYIWNDGLNADWYGYHPSASDCQKIADTVNGYISMYQGEYMGMTV